MSERDMPHSMKPNEEPGLELDTSKIQPRPPPEPFPEPDNSLEVRRKIIFAAKILAVVVVVLAAGTWFVLFTSPGRDLLPETMKTPAAKTALDLQKRAQEATGPTFYTFTDD